MTIDAALASSFCTWFVRYTKGGSLELYRGSHREEFRADGFGEDRPSDLDAGEARIGSWSVSVCALRS
jgi:hypothetical protein